MTMPPPQSPYAGPPQQPPTGQPGQQAPQPPYGQGPYGQPAPGRPPYAGGPHGGGPYAGGPYAGAPHPTATGPYPGAPGPGQQPPAHGYVPYPTGPGGPPKPPRSVGVWPVLGCVAAGAGLLAGLVWYGNPPSDSSLKGGPAGGSAAFPAAEYRLRAAPTLLDGDYRLADDQSRKRQAELTGNVSESNIRDPRATVAQYTSASEAGVLVVSGLSGRIKNPDQARESILNGAAEADGAVLSVPARDFTPAGSEVTVACQVITAEQTDGTSTPLPMCAWADDNTNASVALVTADSATKEASEIDLAAVAEVTVRVRTELREPIG